MQATESPAAGRRILPIVLLALFPFLGYAAFRGAVKLAGGMLEQRYPPPGRMVSAGDHKLHLYCMGTGSPTVVIEPGMGQDWIGWRRVIPELAAITSTCVYDRGGYGWSEPGPWPRTALQDATELHTLLANAAVPGPYILAAHSFGGYIARIYASRYRDTLAGIVLVDPSHEDEHPAHAPAPARRLELANLLDLVPPLGVARLKRMYRGRQAIPPRLRGEPRAFQDRYLIASSLIQLKSERNEFDSLADTEAEVRAAPFPPDLALTVITAALSPSPEALAVHCELQKKLAAASLHGKQVLALESRHMVPEEQPGLIVSAIRDLIPPGSREARPDRLGIGLLE